MNQSQRPDPDQNRLIDEVYETGDAADEDVDLDYDMGDDEQADEVREYERYISDPPANLVIGYPEDSGRQSIARDLDQAWTKRRQRAENIAEDHRPAEVAAMEVVNEPTD